MAAHNDACALRNIYVITKCATGNIPDFFVCFLALRCNMMQHVVKRECGVSRWWFVCLLACLLVCLSARLLVCFFACLLACLLVCLFACLLVCLLVCLFACLLVCLFACLLACLLVCLFACLLVCLFACLSACLPVCLFACLLVCLLVCLSACLLVCLFVCLFVCVCAGQSSGMVASCELDFAANASLIWIIPVCSQDPLWAVQIERLEGCWTLSWKCQESLFWDAPVNKFVLWPFRLKR